jgi:hypothetical protein
MEWRKLIIMKGYVKAIKEYFSLVLYLAIFFIAACIFGLVSLTYKDSNIELYKKIALCFRCMLWTYIMFGDVFYPGIVSRILNYKYATQKYYRIKIFLNNLIRFGLLGLNIILHIQLHVYPKGLAILNVIYIVNLIFCFIPKYNSTLAHKILKLEMVKLREKGN